jgi:hypothetical protein
MSKRKIIPTRPGHPSEEEALKVQPVEKKDDEQHPHHEEDNLPESMIQALISQHDEDTQKAALELPKSEKAGEIHSKFSKFQKSSQGE